ncbi:beta-n-acetylhexosaminidase [Fusarium tjaetaba]|uniref:Beta-hexosaminidase n=1 Tax=Fusarium tjaetaba TaxID=1567544 RepID=A0A8H5S861_9HYPO|nr:beta-n-acetylhexosaminidase [Fusarium tjaetaba]KAF5646320.1 beta-n-acetylhexosaminidase [Fusarium tjaetaba]
MWSKAKALLAIAAFALAPVDAIWPVPKKISTGDKVLFIDQSIDITYNGDFVCWTPPGSVFDSCNHSAQLDTETLLEKQMPYTYNYQPDAGPKFNSKQIVQAGVSRALQAIFKDNFVPWKLRERNSDFEPDLQKKQWVKSLKIVQTEEDDKSTFKPLAGEVDESYSLTLSEKGEASIKAKSSTGILHGLETFLQLFFKHSSGTSWYTPHAPVAIQDAPEYPHRGILLDVARSFFEVEHIKRTIDAMSWSKLNRLHLHITDSQSWPLEIPALPKLAEKGAYRKGLTYSPEDLAGIYEYGIHRGVEVIMEIDMPGHIGVVELAYKDLIVAYNEKPYQWWCKEPPCGAFRMNSTDVYDFLDTLFEDLFPRISPYSAYFHAGGDELNHNDSMLDPGVRSNKTEVLAPLLQKFVDYTHGKIRDAGLTPFVWEEMITEWNMTLGKDVVIQSWLGNGAVKAMAEAGHKVIDSDYNFWYLDCGRGQWLNFDNGEAFKTYYPFNDWCGPTKSWRLIYSHDPRAGLSEEAAKLVLGGEAAVWTETIDSVNLDTIVWPRAAVMGEVLWSGRTDASGQNRSQYDAAPRLAELRERMVARGVSASPIQMPFCTQGNATECAQFEG